MESIFVSIASYQDSEIFPTVDDLFKRATYPQRIYAGVFLQDTNEVNKKFQLQFQNKNIKVLVFLKIFS